MDDGKTGYDLSPVNKLPAIVVVVFLGMLAVEGALALAEAGMIGGAAGLGWRSDLIAQYGVSPEIFAWMKTTGQWPAEHLLRFVTYSFLHYGFVQMAIGGAIFLAMGKLVGEVIGAWAAGVIFFVSAAFGALVYAWAQVGNAWLIGAFPGAYGLIGGFTFVLWARARMTGQNQAQAFSLIAMLMGIQLLFGLIFGTDNTWVSELAGFVSGFALCFVFVPGARAALLARLRR